MFKNEHKQEETKQSSQSTLLLLSSQLTPKRTRKKKGCSDFQNEFTNEIFLNYWSSWRDGEVAVEVVISRILCCKAPD
jgi:hypothetical protein